MILLASQRRGDMASMTGELEWKDTGFLGRTGRGYEERLLPSMSMISWTVRSSAWANILRAVKRGHSKLTTLDFRRGDFGLFRDLLSTVL